MAGDGERSDSSFGVVEHLCTSPHPLLPPRRLVSTTVTTHGTLMASQAPPPVANSGEDVIHQDLQVEPELLAEGVSLEDAYEVDMTVKEILTGGYERIALQFPDELLHDAVPIFRAIRDRLPVEKELYVLADTTYGR